MKNQYKPRSTGRAPFSLPLFLCAVYFVFLGLLTLGVFGVPMFLWDRVARYIWAGGAFIGGVVSFLGAIGVIR